MYRIVNENQRKVTDQRSRFGSAVLVQASLDGSALFVKHKGAAEKHTTILWF